VPLRLRRGRLAADGYLDFLPVGAATTEVTLSLTGAEGVPVVGKRRRTTRMAADALDRLGSPAHWGREFGLQVQPQRLKANSRAGSGSPATS